MRGLRAVLGRQARRSSAQGPAQRRHDPEGHAQGLARLQWIRVQHHGSVLDFVGAQRALAHPLVEVGALGLDTRGQAGLDPQGHPRRRTGLDAHLRGHASAQLRRSLDLQLQPTARRLFLPGRRALQRHRVTQARQRRFSLKLPAVRASARWRRRAPASERPLLLLRLEHARRDRRAVDEDLHGHRLRQRLAESGEHRTHRCEVGPRIGPSPASLELAEDRGGEVGPPLGLAVALERNHGKRGRVGARRASAVRAQDALGNLDVSAAVLVGLHGLAQLGAQAIGHRAGDRAAREDGGHRVAILDSLEVPLERAARLDRSRCGPGRSLGIERGRGLERANAVGRRREHPLQGPPFPAAERAVRTLRLGELEAEPLGQARENRVVRMAGSRLGDCRRQRRIRGSAVADHALSRPKDDGPERVFLLCRHAELRGRGRDLERVGVSFRRVGARERRSQLGAHESERASEDDDASPSLARARSGELERPRRCQRPGLARLDSAPDRQHRDGPHHGVGRAQREAEDCRAFSVGGERELLELPARPAATRTSPPPAIVALTASTLSGIEIGLSVVLMTATGSRTRSPARRKAGTTGST